MRKSLPALAAACLVFVIGIFAGWQIMAGASDANQLIVEEINYSDSTITLRSEAGDTVAYFSNSSKKTWEPMGTFQNGKLVADISWISASSSYTLTFKGDKSVTVGSVALPKQVTNFKATYKANSDTAVSFVNNGNRTIQWRKNGVSSWSNWNTAATNDDLNYLKGNGATLYFRLAPVNGDSVSNPGMRASKEVSVKIPAKKSAPVITVDPSKFTVPLTSKLSYRVLELDENGNLKEESAEWNAVKSTKNYALADIVTQVMVSGTDAAKPAALQIKANATSSAQESRVSTIIIPAQEAAPEEDAAEISYTSSKTLDLTIKAASKENPYEYCIVDGEDYDAASFDYEDAGWVTVESGTAVTLNADKAKAGSHLYIRKKAKGKQGETGFALASKERELIGTTGIQYPEPLKADTLTSIVVPAGVINNGDYGKNMSFTLYSYAKATVSSMELKDAYGNSYGTVECTSVAAKNNTARSKDDAYIITTKITSTAAQNGNKAAWNKELYATIKLSNGETIVSKAEGGVLLYFYPAAKVNNPDAAEKTDFGAYYEQYTDDFTRIYLSTEKEDENSFKFILDFGTTHVMSSEKTGEKTDQELKIGSISYDAYTLSVKEFTAGSAKVDAAEEASYKASPADALICYENYTDTDGNPARRAYVTIHVDQMEKANKDNNAMTHVGSKLPFVIRLNNEEVLNDAVTMKLAETATLKNAPIAWTITEGKLRESETVVQKDAEGNIVSTTENAVNTYSLDLDKISSSYSVGVSDVTWDGRSILYDAAVSGNTIKVTLSNAKINQLSAGGGSKTCNVVIVFSNGYAVKTGCKLTVLSADTQ